MHVICKNNAKYRVFTNLWGSPTNKIMNRENLVKNYGYLDVNKYNNKTTQAFDSF